MWIDKYGVRILRMALAEAYPVCSVFFFHYDKHASLRTGRRALGATYCIIRGSFLLSSLSCAAGSLVSQEGDKEARFPN